MNVRTILRRSVDRVLRHPRVGAALLCVAVAVLAGGVLSGRPGKAVAYLATMLLGALAVDLLAGGAEPPPPIPVRRPRREAALCLLTALLGFGFLSLRFLLPVPWEARPGLQRLAIGVGSLLFAMPTALAACLLLLGYRPRALGLAWRGVLVAPALLALTAGGALLVDPEGVTLWRALEETGGWPGLLVMGLVGAALPEEFLRFALQTRLGALPGGRASGWLLASLAWGLLHVPVFGKWPDGAWGPALFGAVRIVPVGLLWGYATHRTGSLWPALLAHGFNLWGLQNG